MTIRFYIDADLLGVAKILAGVRSDVTYPGDPGGRGPDGFERPPCPVQAGDKDVDWIPQVAQAGWIIISRDRHIQHRPAERQQGVGQSTGVCKYAVVQRPARRGRCCC